MRQLILNYCQYNYWANQRVLDLLLPLSDEELNKELGGSFNTLKQTVFHIWMAESIWMQRLLMVEHIQYPNEKFTGIMQEACKAWLKVSESFIGFCEKQFDDRGFEHEVIYYTSKKEPMKSNVWECIHHCMNHSTFHRGQLINYLRMIGVTKIPSTDLITFQREKK